MLWTGLKSAWSILIHLHAAWSILLLGIVGYILGSEVLSSEWLGWLFAVGVPLSLIAAIRWEAGRRAKRHPATRILLDSGLNARFVLRTGPDQHFPTEIWLVDGRSPVILGVTHWMARWMAFVRNLAISRLLTERERLARSSGIDPRWFTVIAMLPGWSHDDRTVVVNATPVHLSNIRGATALIRSVSPAPSEVSSKADALFS